MRRPVACAGFQSGGKHWGNTRMVNLSFELVRDGPCDIEVNVYDRAGHLVARPVDSVRLPPGRYSTWWKGVGFDGAPSAPGVYLVEYRTDTDRTLRQVRWPATN